MVRGGYDLVMPEGDTIFRTATVLRAMLTGRTIIGAKAQARPGMRKVPTSTAWLGRPSPVWSRAASTSSSPSTAG
jgi:hypothetical protein